MLAVIRQPAAIQAAARQGRLRRSSHDQFGLSVEQAQTAWQLCMRLVLGMRPLFTLFFMAFLHGTPHTLWRQVQQDSDIVPAVDMPSTATVN